MDRIKIKSNSVICYRDTTGREASGLQLEVLSTNWRSVEYTGNISTSTRRKLVNMLSVWSDSIYAYNRCFGLLEKYNRKSLKFLTLTISEATEMDDNTVKRKLLVPFIQTLIRKFNVQHYFWRAEAQANGNIHFHLIIDQYINKSKVNYEWDYAQYVAGIARNEPKWRENYQSPSSRIESCKSTGHVEAYVVKYCLKDEKHRKIEGRVWGCSDSLRELRQVSYLTCIEVVEEFTKLIESTKCDFFEGSHFKIYYIDILRDNRINSSWLRDDIESCLIDNYKKLYVNKLQNNSV
jgi:hypothetical protein